MSAVLVLWLSVIATGLLRAQTATNTDALSLGPGNLNLTNGAPTPTDNSLHIATPPPTTANTTPIKLPSTPTPQLPGDSPVHSDLNHDVVADPCFIPDCHILAALLSLISLGGFLLYQSGLIRAKNVGHSATLLLIGVVFCVIGYWVGGFAVQTGGVGDAHAALPQSIHAATRSDLDHELGFMAPGGHHLGLMGSSGFFLTCDSTNSTNSIAVLFLLQSAMLIIAVAAALGASLERARLLAMAVFAFLIGALIYPLFANWVWGGGWLAQLGHEYSLGHGLVDLAGAGVVHETAGTLALVIALVLGARTGRFGKDKKSIPGHNMPFVLLGTVLLLISWAATNAFTNEDFAAPPSSIGIAGVTVTNTLLAACGGLLSSFFLAGWQKRRPEPALLCRGLLGGAVASCACSALIDAWAAFVIGGLAGLFVHGAVTFLDKRRIDDPVGAAATHGTSGVWGLLATGLFANGTSGQAYNGVQGPVCGLFYGGGWHQLAAQAIGALTGFVVVFILGYAFLILIQKILGIRVPVVEETDGLDWPQTGALGYQGEVESDSPS